MQAMARPASVRALHSSDITLTHEDIIIRLRTFKGDDQGFVPTRTFSLPHQGADDQVYRFWSRLKNSASGKIFAGAPPLSVSVARAVRLAGIIPPPGCAYRGKSLRSGGISAAHAVKVPMPNIMSVSGHTSTTTVFKHYLDVSVRACEGARVLFSRLRHSS